ncbi:MAG: hypothetical protein AABX01_08090 [Candidatus Micrarchaeota archaeon]
MDTKTAGKIEGKNYESILKFYKPNKQMQGSACQFDFAPEKQAVFFEIGKQLEERKFDWANKLAFKMADVDICKILLVLKGRSKLANLFHDPGKGNYASSEDTKNNALVVQKGDFGYFFKLSQQTKDGKVNAMQISLSEDEALLLELMLEEAIRKIYKW